MDLTTRLHKLSYSDTDARIGLYPAVDCNGLMMLMLSSICTHISIKCLKRIYIYMYISSKCLVDQETITNRIAKVKLRRILLRCVISCWKLLQRPLPRSIKVYSRRKINMAVRNTNKNNE